MRVILNDHVENLGERGDRVDVRPGYARNYLLPQGLAYPDTAGNQRRFQQEQKRWEDMDLSRRSAAEAIAEQLNGLELIFERRAGEKDVLFGSVSVNDIARELAEKGFDLDRRRVMLTEAIKELGSFEVQVKVHRDIEVTLPIFVVRPGEQPVRPGDEQPEEAAAVAEAAESAEQAAAEMA